MTKKLKDLKDNTRFTLSKGSDVQYSLQRLDPKKREAIYTSLKSNRTFKAGWGKTVYA